MKKSTLNLTRRERQIMDVIYRQGRATALEVIEQIESPPSYSAIRALLAILERKGYVKHTKDGAKYVYLPTQSRKTAAQAALKRLLSTFFDNSKEKVVAALLESNDSRTSDEEWKRLSDMISQARKAG